MCVLLSINTPATSMQCYRHSGISLCWALGGSIGGPGGTTDDHHDARIVDAKSCQLESWIKKNPTFIEYWALPACNFTSNLELTLGGTLGQDAEGRSVTQIQLQGKTLFRPMQVNSWGTGLAAGVVRHPSINIKRNQTGNLYAYVPTSFSFRDNRFIVHTNLGWLYRMEDDGHNLTWGLGSEIQLATRTWLIAETFSQNKEKPFFQVGLRHWIVADRVQDDATYGNRIESGSSEHWLSISLRLLSVPFLPRKKGTWFNTETNRIMSNPRLKLVR